MYKFMKYGAYIIWGIAALYLIIIFCLCSRIRLGVAITKVTAKFIGQTKSVFLMPPIFMAIVILWVAYWVASAVFIFSVGYVEPRSDVTFLSKMKWSSKTRYVFIYYLFGLLWIIAFIIGCY